MLIVDIAEDRDPLQEAQSALKQAVASLRQARDAGEAGKALDEVDKSVTALRVLLWEKQAAKKTDERGRTRATGNSLRTRTEPGSSRSLPESER